MRHSMIAIILLVVLSACSPTAPVEISPTNPAPAAVLETPPPTPMPDPTLTDTLTLPTPTDALAESLLPTTTPTPLPVVFDLNGYKDFAVSRQYYPGLDPYREQGYWEEINRAFSPSGDQIAFSACWGSMDSAYECEGPDSGLLLVLDVNTGDLVTEVPLGSSWPGGVAFSADGQSLLYGTTEYIALWDLASNSPGLTLLERGGSGRRRFPAVAAAPDDQSYAALVEDSLYVWDPSGQLLLQTPAALTRLGYASIAYSADGARMAFISPGRAGIEVYDTSNWALVHSIGTEYTFDVAFSPNAQWLAAIDEESDTAAVWDLNTGSQIVELDPPDMEVGYIRFNPTGDLLVIAGPGNDSTPDSFLRIGTLYETNQWTQLEERYSYLEWGRIEFSQDGKRMAVLGFSLTIYEEASPELLAGFEVLQQFQNALYSGNYTRAADLFEFDARDEDYYAKIGLQPDDVAGSLERMCAREVIFCYPVYELVSMGESWGSFNYLVRLDNNGTPVTNGKGEQLFQFPLIKSSDEFKLTYLPYER